MVRAARLAGTVFIGELGLDGRLRPVPGVLPAVAAASAAGFGRVVTPPDNLPEAALVPAMQIVAPANLTALLDWLAGRPTAAGPAGVRVVESGTGLTALPAVRGRGAGSDSGSDPDRPGTAAAGPAGSGAQLRDLADVAGQPVARRAAEICAAGGHHLMLLGPPGVGKPMLELKSG